MFYVEAADVPGEGAELHFFFFAWNYLAGPPFLVFPLQHKRLSGSARLGATALVLSLLAYGQGRLDSVYINRRSIPIWFWLSFGRAGRLGLLVSVQR